VKLPIGISDFQKLIQGRYEFADKSNFIKEIVNDGAEVILITRPRRFGKTLNMSMLQYFLQSNYPQEQNLFEGLAVSEDVEFCKTYQNQYPIIFISFKDIKKSNFVDAYADITKLIKKLYASHEYLLEGDILPEHEKHTFISLLNQDGIKTDVEGAIEQLSAYMTKKFNQKPILLIDEYDTPIQAAYMNGYYDEMIELMRSIMGQALKDNIHITKAILTGITRVAQESLFSGVNNFIAYSLLQKKYGQYFGFTEAEVIGLLNKSEYVIPLQGIKEWYNGYRVGDYTLYNPWSIINCLNNEGILKPYWLNTADNSLLKSLVSNASTVVKRRFEELLQGKSVEAPLMENLVFADLNQKEDVLWSFLLYVGYLNVLSTRRQGYLLLAEIAIPNKEVGCIYDEMISEWFSKAISLETYDEFVNSISTGDMERFEVILSAYLIQSGSYFDFNVNTPEQVFHGFILGLVLGLRDSYIIKSNQEGGYGRFDVVLIPNDKKKNGVLIEFKTADRPELLESRAKEALEQIKLKKYTAIFEQHGIKSALAIGLAFCGKQVRMSYENIRT